MTSSWAQKDMEAVLMQLNDRGLPFSKYVFSALGTGMSKLGAGGYAQVYEGEGRKDKKHERKYAIKVIGFGRKITDTEEEFQRKAGVQESLGSENAPIIKIYGYKELRVWIKGDHEVTGVQEEGDESAETPEGEMLRLQFVVMEKLIPVMHRNEKIPSVYPQQLLCDEQEVLKLASHIGRAIAAIHDKGMLHYDIKPDNVFYHEKNGIYKLGDFGVASETEHGFANAPGYSMGYVAPEVFGNKGKRRSDATADIYSFGMMLYVLLNQLCFPGSTSYRSSIYQYEEGFEAPEPVMGSDELKRVVLRMISFDPEERYQSMEEVLNELDRLKYGKRVKYQREHKNTSLVMAAAFAVLGAVAWKLTFGAEQALEYSKLLYLCCGCCILRGGLYLFKKETGFWTFIILVTGTILLIRSGIAWWKVILWFLVVVFTLLPALAGGALLTAKATDAVVKTMALSVTAFSDYRWIAVLFLSLALYLKYVHFILGEHDDETTKTYLKKNYIWWIGIFAYGALALTGYSLRMGVSHQNFMCRLIGAENITKFFSYDPGMIGMVGAAFCLGWMLREWGLVQLEKIAEKSKKWIEENAVEED